MLRRQGAAVMSEDQLVVYHRPHILVGQQLNFGDLVRGAEAIKEMNERHAGLQRRRLYDQCEILRFLNRSRS
jgi:hypothetical protein